MRVTQIFNADDIFVGSSIMETPVFDYTKCTAKPKHLPIKQIKDT